MSLVALSGVRVERGGSPILTDVSVSIERGERWGLVGRNGVGKTSLIATILDELPVAAGTLVREPGVRIRQLGQDRELGDAGTVWEVAAGAWQELRALGRWIEEEGHRLTPDTDAAALATYDAALERFRREGGYEIESYVDRALQGLGFDPQEARTRPIRALSGGEHGRLALARELAVPADLLILDEPTNHLDLETIDWLRDYLIGLDCALLLISHDRVFLDEVVDHVLHLEGGTARVWPMGYADFVEARVADRMARRKAFDQQRKEIAVEEEFIRRNIAGQKTAQAKSRRKKLARMPRLAPPVSEEDTMALRLEPLERGGDQVAVLDRFAVGVPGRPRLISEVDLTVRRGEVIGVVGPNGAGKSTLIKGMTGHLPATAGEVRIGPSIQVAWMRQDLSNVPPEKTLFDIIHDERPMWDRGYVQGHLGRFGFSGDTVRRRAGTLSGGETARVALALLMLSRANLLVLDEPTNHLDVESIEVLESALERFGGTVLLISHDRALLRAVTTRIWRVADGRVHDYPGGFEAFEAHRAELSAGGGWRTEGESLRSEAPVEDALAGMSAQERREARKARQAELRAATREAERLEREIGEDEARIAELRGELEDPALYARDDAADRAHELTAALAPLESGLEAKVTAWTEALERVEALGPG